ERSPQTAVLDLASDAAQPHSAGFDLTRDLTYEFPDYVSDDGRCADDFLRDVCYRRAREHYGAPLPEEVEIRLLKELDLVRAGKRAGFFLRLWEILQYAHENKMPARGRGSSVGSMVCFLLGLSGIDPMKYHLVVERFLNEERIEADVPDIDLDFGRDARDKMFRHILDKYGTAHAALVCNFIEYRYPSAVRHAQVARGLRYVAERYGREFVSEGIDLADHHVYEMIQRGDVLGIVQIQSRAQIQVLLRIRVQRIEDLIIQVALIRPGPIQGGAVHPYIARCLGLEPVVYDHPSLEPALAETKGVFVFPEQVLQAAIAIAGFTSGQAEML